MYKLRAAKSVKLPENISDVLQTDKRRKSAITSLPFAQHLHNRVAVGESNRL